MYEEGAHEKQNMSHVFMILVKS